MTLGLQLSDVTVGYGGVSILDGIDLPAWPAGSMVALLGPNASGKSTLLKALAGMLAYRGTATFAGADLGKLSRRRRAARIGYLPQTPPQPTGLLTYEVALSAFRVAAPELPRNEVDRRIAEVFDLLDLRDAALSRVETLSGGKRQRLGLAMVLARRTALMLLDEPTSALDLRWQLEALGTIQQTVRARSAFALVAIHDINLALRFFDGIAVLGQGQLLAAGAPEAVVTPALLRRVYGVEARIERCSQGQPLVVADAPAMASAQATEAA